MSGVGGVGTSRNGSRLSRPRFLSVTARAFTVSLSRSDGIARSARLGQPVPGAHRGLRPGSVPSFLSAFVGLLWVSLSITADGTGCARAAFLREASVASKAGLPANRACWRGSLPTLLCLAACLLVGRPRFACLGRLLMCLVLSDFV